MVQICPRCGGKEIGCPVCHLPPRRKLPKENRLVKFLRKIYLPIVYRAQTWPVQGVDLSSWNGVMDLSITKSKTQYGFIRLGYGEGYKDYRCDTYRQSALDIDWPYGVYWFCYPGYSWQKHAEGLAEVANEFPFQLDIVIDAETTYLDKNATLTWFINMENRVYELTGKRPIIYTSKGFWDERVARSTHFSNRKNWVANWTTAPAPLVPIDFNNIWGHWQHSADGNGKAKEYGMIRDGDVDMDLNRYYGTPEQFSTQYGLEPPTPPEPVPEIKPIKYVIVTANLNMRSLPDVTSLDIGTLKSDSDVPVIEEKNGMYRIEGWISKYYTKPK